MKNSKLIIGLVCAIGAAVCYGTNPLARFLYAEGMQVPSVLFYRFGLAWVIMAIVMMFRRESLRVTRREFLTLSSLGILFILSSTTLYTSILLSLAGVALLSFKDEGGTFNILGIVLVLISALTYALYIIVVDKSPLQMSSFKINFYVLFYCALGNVVYAFLSGQPLALPPTPTAWLWVSWLAVVPAIMALVMMVYAAKYLGSTPTAILGALEPTTAVLIGVFVFAEPFSSRLLLGIVLVLAAVTLVVLGKARKKGI